MDRLAIVAGGDAEAVAKELEAAAFGELEVIPDDVPAEAADGEELDGEEGEEGERSWSWACRPMPIRLMARSAPAAWPLRLRRRQNVAAPQLSWSARSATMGQVIRSWSPSVASGLAMRRSRVIRCCRRPC